MPAPSPAARAAVRRDIEPRIAAVRRFSRFYTRRLGLLHDGFLDSPFSLAEARVLYELSRREATTASAVAAELDLDPGYLSRILRSFAERGLVSRTRSSEAGGRAGSRSPPRDAGLLRRSSAVRTMTWPPCS